MNGWISWVIFNRNALPDKLQMCPNILPARPIEKSGVEVILIKCLTGSMLRIRPIYVPPPFTLGVVMLILQTSQMSGTRWFWKFSRTIIVFKGQWELILTAIEKQDFIFSADGGLAINLEWDSVYQETGPPYPDSGWHYGDAFMSPHWEVECDFMPAWVTKRRHPSSSSTSSWTTVGEVVVDYEVIWGWVNL